MRLVDADALIDRLNERKSREQGIRNIADILRVKSFIEEQSTAYDIDKVVEELEKLADESYKAYCIAFNSDDRAEYDAYTNAIEIVKQGGVSDDVCEWELTDTGKLMPYKTSCGNEDLYDNHYKYCPYCGKKIKVVDK